MGCGGGGGEGRGVGLEEVGGRGLRVAPAWERGGGERGARG